MKRLVVTNKYIYDDTGMGLGYEVLEIDGYTREELKSVKDYCKICRNAGGQHGQVWVHDYYKDYPNQ